MVRDAVIRALLLWLWLAAPALATQDGWPALFDVIGVAADDVLNLRAAPGPSARVVGRLAPDATGIEVIRPDARQRWGLVNTGEGTAWVSLRYLARRPGQWDRAFPQVASCFGTEPFWTLAIDGDAARMSTPERVVAGRVTARLGSANRRDRFGLTADLGGAPLSGVIANRACNDGMSDREYGLAVDAIFEGAVLSGCCTLSQ
ncbi:COG3650 family protein [Jannaschia ovalis]|uniref:SH3 domain-containing protein n=1 Tax=Jannaschia ovalis TaxID=3038773 RepID=A0ABY8LJC9_9RHOB|nr:SH3 domain-containing protein [Jannaschia sp. GRR-S6-38]WGH80309.1 SH3 domain-containing protein [Jannaschia sp. GRR-S6-38]